ncbi:MAG: 4-hydroxy-tetrahydrodipicolinate synthase [Sphingobacteriaceae bacterium]
MNKFRGTGVAMITPFHTDGTVDYNSLGKLIEHLILGGVEYLVTLGTTGETATLNKNEKKKILAYTAETVAGRRPLIAGVGGNCTQEVLDNLEELDATLFDAILSVSPYYNKPTQEGIYLHYKAIAEHSSLPIILYNVPARTGSNIQAETTLRLANDFKNIIGIKEASGNFEQFNQVLRDKPEAFMFISGDDPLALPLIALGASGVISVVGNAVPQLLTAMIRLGLGGDFAAARELHFQLLELTRLCFVEGNPAGVKAALKLQQIGTDHVRLPLVNASGDLSDAISRSLNKLLVLK